MLSSYQPNQTASLLVLTSSECSRHHDMKSCSANLSSLDGDHWLYGCSMINAAKTSEEASRITEGGQSTMLELAASSKPIVAAIMGTCLGGGLEVRLRDLYLCAGVQESFVGC